MGTGTLQQPNVEDAYETLYDVLKKMYWEASTVDSKDEVFGVMEAVGDIIDQLDAGDLDKDTASFMALQSKINDANKALQGVRNDINTITRNISTASKAMAAITRVLSFFPVA